MTFMEIMRMYWPDLRQGTSGGSAWYAPCPFCEDKSGVSFVVDSQYERWHCFGACNKGGDMLALVKAMRDDQGWPFS